MLNDLLQLNAAEFNIEIKHWSWLDIDDFTVSMGNASFSPSSVSFLSVLDLAMCLQSVVFQTKMTMSTLTAHCKKRINIQKTRWRQKLSYWSQHKSRPTSNPTTGGKKSYFIHWCECWIQSKGAKIDLLLQSVEQIYSVLHVWSLDLLLVNAFSGPIRSNHWKNIKKKKKRHS